MRDTDGGQVHGPGVAGRRTVVWPLVVAGFVLLGGVLLTWWMVERTDRGMREALIVEARLAALAVDTNRLAGLTGSPADLGNPSYGALKERLADVVHFSGKYRFCYLMGARSDGAVFFFVDNEPDDSIDCSPPGQLYVEASPELRRTFHDGLARAEGPFTDRWGTWVSAFVPLHDPQHGGLVAVLGVDTDAGDWRLEILSRSLMPGLLMFCLLMLLVLRLLAVRSRALLRESAERHRIMFTDSPDACMILAGGVVTDCNLAVETMFRGPRESIVGKRPDVLSPPWQPDGTPSEEASEKRIAEALACGVKKFEWTHRRCDGGDFPAEVSIAVMTLAGCPVLFTALRDISERKRMEEALQQQLEEKETLLRETHHRIMNNLATISGFLYLQAQSAAAPEAAADLHAAVRRVNGMGKLYEKMLIAGEYREIDAQGYLGELVDSVVEQYSGKTRVTIGKNIEKFTIGSKTMFSLGIIINELLTNALKYAFGNRAEGVVRITAVRDGNRIGVSLEDDGYGLPEGFDAAAGTGFGLSLVRMLCRQIDATIGFENGAGTRVRLEFTVPEAGPARDG